MGANTTVTSDLATLIIERYQKWKADRKPLERRWEASRGNFLGLFYDQKAKKWKKNEGEGWRSRTHINVTRQKVSHAVAIVADIVLRGGRIPFALQPSAWDKLTFQDTPPAITDSTRKDIEDQETLIKQQTQETHADRACMKNIWSAAEYGETWAKKTIGTVQRSGWRPKDLGIGVDISMLPPEAQAELWEPYTQNYQTQHWTYVSNWNMFRDLETDDLRDSVGMIHRDFWSNFDAREKIGKPNFIDAALELALRENDEEEAKIESSDVASLPPNLRELKNRKRTMRYLEYWGRVDVATATKFEEELKKNSGDPENFDIPSVRTQGEDNPGEEVEILCGVLSGHVVLYVQSQPEERPFERAVWDENLDEIGGSGVADNVKDTQIMLDGAVRAFQDNKALSANVILAFKRRFLKTALKDIEPGKGVEISEDCDDVRKAVQQLMITDVGESLLSLIGLAERFADEDSMIPKIQQGQVEGGGKETAFQAAQRLEKSGKYIAGVIRNFDEQLIEPMITSYYKRNMEDPEIEVGKGSFTVKALGFTSFQNQILRITKLQQFLSLILSNPQLAATYSIDKIVEEIGAAMDVDIDNLKRPEEEVEAARQQEAAAAQETQRREEESHQATVNKENAQAQKAVAEIAEANEQLQLDRAKLVIDTEAKQRELHQDSAEALRARHQP